VTLKQINAEQNRPLSRQPRSYPGGDAQQNAAGPAGLPPGAPLKTVRPVKAAPERTACGVLQAFLTTIIRATEGRWTLDDEILDVSQYLGDWEPESGCRSACRGVVQQWQDSIQ